MKRFVMSVAVMILVSMVAVSAFAATKKVLFIDSYHEGYAWSDGVLNGVNTGLEGKDIELRFETAAGGNIIHDHGYWANPRFTVAFPE